MRTENLRIEREKEQEEFGELYEASGLELGEDWTDTAVFSFACRSEGTLLGAATVSLRYDRYILDFIAVKNAVRKQGIGERLTAECIERCIELGACELWLQARTPAFFRRIGAKETGGKTLLRECLSCPDYRKECSPVEMKFVFQGEITR